MICVPLRKRQGERPKPSSEVCTASSLPGGRGGCGGGHRQNGAAEASEGSGGLLPPAHSALGPRLAVRDALYNSLLSDPRAAFHLRIAEEIERRNDNRLPEVAEVLAHHYSQTSNLSKCFAYLTMAGIKSLGVYSLDEAGAHFNAALAVLDKNHNCASDDQTIQFFAGYMLFLNLTAQWNFLIDVIERYLPRLNRMGEN